MVENMNQAKITEALRELRTAIQNAASSLDQVRSALETTLQFLDQDSSENPSIVGPDLEVPQTQEPGQSVIDEPQIDASVLEDASSIQGPSVETPEPTESIPEAPPEPLSETAPPVVQPPEASPPAPSVSSPSPPRPPSPPPPPPVAVLKQNAPSIPNNPPASSSYSPGSTVVTNASHASVSEILDGVYQLAVNGSTGAILSNALISARDAIQQIVSVSPVFHEISSYGRDLRMLAANPLTQAQITDLKEHTEDWKRRLGK